MTMKKITDYSLVTILAIVLFSCVSENDISDIEILSLGENGAVISWISKNSQKGYLEYFSGPDKSDLKRVSEKISSTLHELNLTGLEPDKTYFYKIKGGDKIYNFKTKHSVSGYYSFLLLNDPGFSEVSSLFISEEPEFIVSLTDLGIEDMSDLKPFVPVYDRRGVSSKYLGILGHQSENSSIIKWTGLNLILAASQNEISNLLNETERGKPTGIIFTDNFTVNDTNRFLQVIEDFNSNNTSKKIAFTISLKETMLEEVSFLQNVAFPSDEKYARIDIEPSSASITFLKNNITLPLIISADTKKISCEECRILADRGSYLKSIEAYRNFISQDRDDFLKDDALFSIAEIYDSKLFDYNSAIENYEELYTKYPESSFAPQAFSRVKYLKMYSDHDFIPFSIYQKIKTYDFASEISTDQKLALLDSLHRTVMKYPDSNIAFDIEYWSALQMKDDLPFQAISRLNDLSDKYPDHELVKTLPFLVGGIYYDQRKYEKAIEFYEKSFITVPEYIKNAEAQIGRANRNIKRQRLFAVSVISAFLFLFAAFFKKPGGISFRIIKITAATIILSFLIIFSSSYIIYEQFSSIKELLLISSFLSLSNGFSALVTGTFRSKKIFSHHGASAAVSIFSGIIILIACIYISIYVVNEHYLIILKL